MASPIVSVRAIEEKNWSDMALTTLLRALVIYIVMWFLNSNILSAIVLALMADIYMAFSIWK